jgi:Flp pilus assembly protein TadD
MYRSLGRRQEAIQAFEAAWRIDPAVPGVAFNLASLYRQTGDRRAAAMERRVAQLARGGQSVTGLRVRYNQQQPDSRAVLQLARAEAAAGASGTALHRLRKLLTRDPVNLSALRLYRRIDQASREGVPPYPRPDPL